MTRCARLVLSTLLPALLLLAAPATLRADRGRDRAITRTLQRTARHPVVRAALRRGALIRVAHVRQSDGHPATLALDSSSICLLGALVKRPHGPTSVPLSRRDKRSRQFIALSSISERWSGLGRSADIERKVIAEAKSYLRGRGELAIGDGPALGFVGFVARHPKLTPVFIKAMRKHGVVSSQMRVISSLLKGAVSAAAGLSMIGLGLHDAVAPAIGREPLLPSGGRGRLLAFGGAAVGLMGSAMFLHSTSGNRTAHFTAVSRAMRDTLTEARARGISLGKLKSWL